MRGVEAGASAEDNPPARRRCVISGLYAACAPRLAIWLEAAADFACGHAPGQGDKSHEIPAEIGLGFFQMRTHLGDVDLDLIAFFHSPGDSVHSQFEPLKILAGLRAIGDNYHRAAAQNGLVGEDCAVVETVQHPRSAKELAQLFFVRRACA